MLRRALHQPLGQRPAHGRVQPQTGQVELLRRLPDGLLHRVVVDDVPRTALEKIRPDPVSVGHPVPGLPGLQVVQGHPPPEQGHPGLQPLLGREEQHQGGQIGALGQVQPAEAPLSSQILPHRPPSGQHVHPGPLRPVKLGLVVDGHRHPAHRFHRDPLVQPQPAEQPLRRLALPGRPGLPPEIAQAQVVPQAGVAGVP